LLGVCLHLDQSNCLQPILQLICPVCSTSPLWIGFSLISYCEISVSHGGEYKVFWDVAPVGLRESDWCFRGAYCLHHQVFTCHTLSWQWRQYAPLKCQSIATRLQDTTSQKTAILIWDFCSYMSHRWQILQVLWIHGICKRSIHNIKGMHQWR
jgi:hypothetical protein